MPDPVRGGRQLAAQRVGARPLGSVRWDTALALLFATSITLFGRPVVAGGELSERWTTIETEHFRVHAAVGTESLAADVAAMSEAAHDVLAPLFDPSGRPMTDVVIVDEVDSANGSAGVIPRRRVRLFAAPPEPDESLGYYDSWMWNLIVHEYIHILHIDTIWGLPRLYNRVFGRRASPNQAMPRWLIEGLATWFESTVTGYGRLESPYFRMFLRSAAASGQIPDLGTMSGVPDDWPDATSWYLYGAFFVDHLIRVHGWEAVRSYLRDYGDNILPFAVNRTARRHFGEDMPQAWQRWRATEVVAAAVARARRTVDGITPAALLTEDGRNSRFVTRLPDGRPIWLYGGGHAARAAVFPSGVDEPAETDETTTAWPLERSGRFSALSGRVDEWIAAATRDDSSSTSRDGHGQRGGSDEIGEVDPRTRASNDEVDGEGPALVVAQTGPWRGWYAFGDLWLVDRGGYRWTRLTDGARAHSPDVSPDSSRVVYASYRPGGADLEMIELGTPGARTIWQSAQWGVASTPRFIGDDRIVFGYRAPGTPLALVLLDLESGAHATLTQAGAHAIDPSPSPDGRYLLYSAVEQADGPDAAYDVWAMRLDDGVTRRLTCSFGGAFSPTIAAGPDGEGYLHWARYSARGFDIARATKPVDLDAFFAASAGDGAVRCGRRRRGSHAANAVVAQRGRDAAAGPADAVDAVGPTDDTSPSDQQSWREGLRTEPIFAQTADAELIEETRRYNGLFRAHPTQWFPVVADDGGDPAYGLTVSGADPVGKVAWAGTLTYSVANDDVVGSGEILTQIFYPIVSLSAGRAARVRSRGMVAGSAFVPFVEETIAARAALSFPLSELAASQRLNTGYTLSWSRFLRGEPQVEHAPTDIEPQLPMFGRFHSFFVGWSWSDTEGYAESISAEQGRSISSTVRLSTPVFGSDVSSGDVGIVARAYRRVPWWGRHHAVAVQLRGGLGVSSSGRRGLFVVGGVPAHDAAVALYQFAPSGTAHVRGYPPGLRSGDRFYLANAEYRLPLVTIDAGHGTLPFYAGRVHAAFFVDAGDALTEHATPSDALVGAGAEVRLSTLIGYGMPANFRLGAGHGLGPEGVLDVYFLFGNQF